MRRFLAVTLAGLGLALALYAAYTGYVCGVRSVSEGCTSTEECFAESECHPRIHPFLPAYALAALASIVFAWRDEAFLPLLLGVAGGAFGTLAVFSVGAWGLGISLLLVGAGIALAPREPVAWAALAAALLPIPMLLLVMFTASLAAVWVAVMIPLALWLAFAAFRWRRQIVGVRA